MLLKYFINERMTTSNAIDPFLAQVTLSMYVNAYIFASF